jgi:hypothetical protein
LRVSEISVPPEDFVTLCYQRGAELKAYLFLGLAILIGAIVVLIFGLLFVVACNLVKRRAVFTGVGEWSTYPLVGFLLTAIVVALLMYAHSRGISDRSVSKWMAIIITGGFVFGTVSREFWPFRERWTFWVALSVLVVAHFALLSRVDWSRTGNFWALLVVGIPELALVSFLFSRLFPRTARGDADGDHADLDGLS